MSFVSRDFPEAGAGGYSSVDGTVEFYSRVGSLLRDDMTVLDFGAGRGGWFEDDPVEYRRTKRLLKGRVREVLGCDVDAAVLENRAVDRAFVCDIGSRLELGDSSIDLIICDYVFEHVADPAWLGAEFERILKPGGWICGRTPGKYSYVALAARAVPNRLHGQVLGSVQPGRKTVDVFPTVYRMNTRKALASVFPRERYEDCTYYYAGEPAYHFGSAVMYQFLRFIAWVSPRPFYANLFVFLRKKS